MKNYSRAQGRKHGGGAVIAPFFVLFPALGLSVAALLFQLGPSAPRSAKSGGVLIPSAVWETEQASAETEATQASFSPSETGEPTQVQCKSSYTAAYSQAAASDAVAQAGDATLTNETLQVLYLSQVNAWRSAEEGSAPDFSLPLDAQECPLEDGLSWQQYFLKRAVQSWLAQQAVLYAAAQPQPITEEAYQPDLISNLHEKYIAPDLPLNDFLYQDQDSFEPNSMHQAYLDGLASTLDALAQNMGYDSLSDAASAAGLDADQWVQAATDYNTAYMYFTEKSYDAAVTDEEIAAYLSENPSSDELERVVSLRQILLVPDGAATADDGTVIATEAQWEAARQEAEALLQTWKSEPARYGRVRSSEAEFAQMATESSDDAGSSLNGGLYYHIRQGQLIDALDEWCFDEAREELDCTVLRTELGYHVVLLTDICQSDALDAEEALLYALQQAQWQQWLDEIDANVDYSAVVLWADASVSLPSLEDALYPDIAHQRFPEVMVYLQQDYFYYPFGSRYIGKNGCGLAALAMLATYMTDSLQTPAMMSDLFGDAFFDYLTRAVDSELFIMTPAEMGFYLDKLSYSIEEVIQALENGQMVISRQTTGVFTDYGHYILLSGYNEEDDTFQVRDSNMYAYGNLTGYTIDRFSRWSILSGGEYFFIMQKKVTAIPACARCGGDFEETAPEALFSEDYLCEKCAAALSRRNRFLDILEAFGAA